MNWELFVDPAFSTRLCFTLLHPLWIVAILAILAKAADLIWRNSSLEKRYAIHVAAILLGVAAIPITFLVIGVPENIESSPIEPHAVAFDQAPAPPQAELPAENNLPAPANEMQPILPATQLTGKPPASEVVESPVVVKSKEKTASVWMKSAPWIVVFYLAGVVLMLARLLVSIIKANRLVASATVLTEGPLVESLRLLVQQWNVKIVPVIAQAEQIIVPTVVGLIKPTILLPASALSGLRVEELELILAHELAHIKRYDMWINLLQRLAEAILFFNPAIWYLSRRISTLREYCCDEMTCNTNTASTPNRRIQYATALLRVVELAKPESTNSHDLASLAANGRSPSEVRRRVARLFGEPLREPVRFSRGMGLALGLFATLLLCSPVLWSTRADMNTEQQENNRSEEKSESDTSTISDNTPRLFRLNVVGPDGKPVPHVSVEIRTSPAPTAKQIRRGKFIRTATYGPFAETDKQGRLEIMLNEIPKRFNLSIKKPGYGPYWAEWSSHDHPSSIPNEFTAKLDKGWSAGGIVVDSEGKPVEGVRIKPSVNFKKRPGVTSKLGVGTRIKTDAKGAWRFDLIPDSKKYVHVVLDHADYQALRIPLQRDKYEIKLSEKPTAIIKLNRGLTVSGTVTDETGKPIPDALVRTKYLNDEREAKTDQQGKYLLNGCEPKLSRIVVTAKGKAIEMQKVMIGPEMLPVNFAMKPGGKIRIRVVDEQGKGISKARIFYQRWRNETAYFPFDRVNQYADVNGIWEWDEAPLDEFTADICGTEMQLAGQSLIAGNKEYKEYTFTPPEALVISGRVIDAKTKKAINNFRAIPGFRFRGTRKNIFWKQTNAYEVTNGNYRFRHTGGRIAYQVRIEADGYKVAISRDIKPNEGKVNLDFSLETAPNITAIILTPDGKPAIKAKVVIGEADSQINIKNGEFSSQTHAVKIDSSAEGRISFPARDEEFQLYLLHPTGFAFLKSEEGFIPERVSLTPWARLEGTFRVGSKIVPFVRLRVTGGTHSFPDFGHHVWVDNSVTTDKNGKFVFDRIIPGDGSISRYFVHMVNQGPTEETSSKRVPVKYVAGKTIKLDLGRTGRPVIGKLVLPHSTKNEQLKFWKQASLQMATFAGEPLPQPTPPANIKTAEQRKAWGQQWSESDQGKVWKSLYKLRQQILSETPRYEFSVSQDGTFRIDNVPEGDYVINGAGITDFRFTVPPLKKEYMEEPLDLGELTIGGRNPAPKADEKDSNVKKKPATNKTSQSKPVSSDRKIVQVASADRTIVQGTITGVDGKPVVGAFVAAVGLRMVAGMGTDNVVFAEGVTDRAGRYELPLVGISSMRYSQNNVIARTKDSEIAWKKLDVDSKETTINLKLKPQQLIQVKLVDATGKPVKQLPVQPLVISKTSPTYSMRAEDRLGSYSFGFKPPPKAWLPIVKSDADGLLTVPNVPAGFGVYLEVSGTDQYARQGLSLNSGRPEKRIESDGTYRATIKNMKPGEIETVTLAPARFFEGIVLLGETGMPAANADISIWASDQEPYGSMMSIFRKTDAKGRFRLNPYAGVRYGILAHPPKGSGYHPKQLNDLRWDEKESKKIVIKLDQGVLAHGTIVDAQTGKPLQNAAVQYIPQSNNKNIIKNVITGWQGIQKTDADGKFAITIFPGPGTLVVHADDRHYILQEWGSRQLYEGKPGGWKKFAHAFQKVNPKLNEPMQAMNIQLKRGTTVKGKLVDEKGKPIPQAVFWSPLQYSSSLSIWGEGIEESFGGKFQVNGLQTGKEYTLFFLDPQNQLGAKAVISTKKPSPTIVLKPCGSAKVQFVDSDGKPLSKSYALSLNMVVRPGITKYNIQAGRRGEVMGDELIYDNIAKDIYKGLLKTDDHGKITYPALIPGATYRFIDFKDGEPTIAKEFVAQSSEEFDMGKIVVDFK